MRDTFIIDTFYFPKNSSCCNKNTSLPLVSRLEGFDCISDRERLQRWSSYKRSRVTRKRAMVTPNMYLSFGSLWERPPPH